LQVVLDRMLGKHLPVLGDETEASSGDDVRFSALHFLSGHADATARRRRNSRYCLERGGLTRSVATQQSHGLALDDRDAHIEQDLAGAVEHVDTLRLEHNAIAHACSASYLAPR